MISPTAIFRLSILASILLGILGAVVDAIFPMLVPEVLWQAQEALASPDLRPQDILFFVIATPVICVAIVSAVGLYAFRPWSRALALYSTLACFLIYPLLDVAVASQWSLMLTDVSTILWGAALAMAFLPPLSERFGRLRANSALQRTGGEPPAAEGER